VLFVLCCLLCVVCSLLYALYLLSGSDLRSRLSGLTLNSPSTLDSHLSSHGSVPPAIPPFVPLLSHLLSHLSSSPLLLNSAPRLTTAPLLAALFVQLVALVCSSVLLLVASVFGSSVLLLVLWRVLFLADRCCQVRAGSYCSCLFCAGCVWLCLND
jgi:hypothetical protein